MPYRHTSRSVLIAGPCLAGIIGLAYTLGDASRTAAPSFDAAKSVASMHTWGWVFLAGAVVMGAALLTRNQKVLSVSLFIGGTLYSWWGACFAIQALTDDQSSLVAWALYAVVAMIHFIIAVRCWRHR